MSDRDKQCNESEKGTNERPEWADDEAVHERFFEKVDFDVNEEGCHRWTGATQDPEQENSYGSVRIYNKTRSAHRVRYIFARGAVEGEKDIDHLCNNKWCVRLDHLEAVTRGINIKRAWEDGLRTAVEEKANKGSNNGQAKLTEEDVKEILVLYSRTDLSQSELAKMFDVSQALVGGIYRGERWEHIDPAWLFPWPEFDQAAGDWAEIFDSLIETERLARLIAEGGGD